MKVTEIIIIAEESRITLWYEDGSYWTEVTDEITPNETFKEFHYHVEGTGDINIWLGFNKIEAFVNGYGVPLIFM